MSLLMYNKQKKRTMLIGPALNFWNFWSSMISNFLLVWLYNYLFWASLISLKYTKCASDVLIIILLIIRHDNNITFNLGNSVYRQLIRITVEANCASLTEDPSKHPWYKKSILLSLINIRIIYKLSLVTSLLCTLKTFVLLK